MCAFCAHRLGQARKPSHVQRRFLQSSRPHAKPPAEAAAVREEENVSSPVPTWGRLGPVGGNGLGPSATWGHPIGNGAIPSIPAGPTGSWGRPSTGVNGVPAGPMPSNRPQAIDDLLPAERRARQLMLKKEELRQELLLLLSWQ